MAIAVSAAVRADSQSAKHIPALDGLRAVAILLVVASHLWRGGPIPGGLGVTLFFFLSGFLITGLLIDEMQRTGRIRLSAFYIRRFRRLMPAMAAMVLVICAIYALWLGEWSGGEMFAALFYLMNYYEIFHVALGLAMSVEIGTLWSLAIEEHFYLLFPLVMALAWKFGRRLFYVLIAICLAVLLWRYYLASSGWYEARTYMGTDTRIDSILFGCLLTIALRLGFNLDFLASKKALLGAAVVLAVTLLIRNPLFRETLRYSMQGLAFVPLFCFILFKRSFLAAVLETAPMVWLGKISYSLYLWHFPILDLCRHLPAPVPVQLTIGTAATFAAAVVSYYWIETPFRIPAARPQLVLVHKAKPRDLDYYDGIRTKVTAVAMLVLFVGLVVLAARCQWIVR